jgi:hypothetical protein
VAAVTLIGFAAWHTLFNPDGSLVEVFKEANVAWVLGMVALFDVALLGFWWHASRARRQARAAAA